MILIADSGSTKCDWALMNDKREVVHEQSTMGFNPFFHSAEMIKAQLQYSGKLYEMRDEVKEIFYYGVACSSEDRCGLIASALQSVFTNAKLNVHDDLLGAALATSDNRKSIVCILGTGSNAAFFDGKKLVDDKYSLGWILGDEGSGAYFGKRILADYLYGKLPPQIADELKKDFALTRENIFENVYRKPYPNVYLASFAKYLSKHKQYYYVPKLIQQGFNEFIEVHVCRFENFSKVPVHFIGSMPFFFEDVLREVCNKKNITVGKIMQQPIHGLVEYFRSRI